MKKYRGKILTGIIVLVILAIAFFSGSSPSTQTWSETSTEPLGDVIVSPTEQETAGEITQQPNEKNVDATSSEEIIQTEENGEINTPAIPQTPTCTLSVDCISVYNNPDMLKSDKRDVIPDGGIIYSERTVSFTEGESVFDVLRREMTNNGIPLEFVYTPMYDSVYIEGINNLYEFDCGSRSGWIYRVNGQKMNVGSSQCIVKQGDIIRIYYTCNFSEER